jgi:hypothetical protein
MVLAEEPIQTRRDDAVLHEGAVAENASDRVDGAPVRGCDLAITLREEDEVF